MMKPYGSGYFFHLLKKNEVFFLGAQSLYSY